MGIKFDPKSSDLFNNLENMPEKAKAAILMYAHTSAAKLESEMKTKRPWTDRTGAAKQRLQGRASVPDPNTVRITLSHGVDYGVWLEYAKEKRYAILEPTIRLQGPDVVKGMENLLDKMEV